MTRLRFGGHEGFPPRSPWPAKGVTALAHDPYVFSRDDATVTFGVGKNMVASIRFWCLQMGIIQAGEERSSFKPTALGRALFDIETGYDPYLEYPETLWILHHQLCSRYSPSSVFRLVFGSYAQPHFTRESLFHWITEQIQRQDSELRVSSTTIERDIDILIRTYRAPRLATRGRVEEDSFDSPLGELSLITETDPGQYKLQRRSSSIPNTKIVERVLLDYWREYHPDERVLAFDTLQYREGSPGRVLCLSPDDFAESLETLSRANDGVFFDETAGMRSVHLTSATALHNTDGALSSLKMIYGGPL